MGAHIARQTDLVLGALCGGPLTNWDMFTRLGVGRGHARIYDLRRMGFNIRTDTITRLNRRGDESKIALYTLLNGGRRSARAVLDSTRRPRRGRKAAKPKGAATARRARRQRAKGRQ